MNRPQYDIAIIGGGPAGSTAALFLAQRQFRVCLIEKRAFSRETLCGEFLSREVSRVLSELGLGDAFLALHPNPLTSLKFCPAGRRTFAAQLPFTAYGMKRGTFDSFLLDQARRAGAAVYQPRTVLSVEPEAQGFALKLNGGGSPEQLTARYVVAAFGKNASLDDTLRRPYRTSRSRLNGIKFHLPRRFMPNVPDHEIQLYTGPHMYCGVNVVGDDTVTLCFLEERTPGDVRPRDRIHALMQMNRSFAGAVSGDFERSLPSFPVYGAADIYFGRRPLVGNGVFAVGDAAQVIAPLAGDGIGMAMESARILADVLTEGRGAGMSDPTLGGLYVRRWGARFHQRLRTAKIIQRTLLSGMGSEISRLVLSGYPSLLPRIIEYTRG